MWTWSRVPAETIHTQVAQIVRSAYEACGKTIMRMSVFKERHPNSKSDQEQSWHYHVVVQTTQMSRWKQIADHMRQEGNAFMSASTSSVGRGSCWTASAYCYVPTAKKPLSELDTEYELTPGHPDIPQRLSKSRPQRLSKSRSVDRRIGPCANMSFAALMNCTRSLRSNRRRVMTGGQTFVIGAQRRNSVSKSMQCGLSAQQGIVFYASGGLIWNSCAGL